MDSEVIARLKELESKATAPQWVAAAEKNDLRSDDQKYGRECYIINIKGAWPPIVSCPFRYHDDPDYCRELPDLEFIAALRNHAKDLIRAAELSEARKTVCEAATKHRATNYWCDAASGSIVLAVDDDTDRKLADALSALAALEAEEAGG